MIRIPIKTARFIGEKCGAQRLAIVAVDADGVYTITTWGKKMRDCRAMRHWCERHGEFAAVEMHAIEPA